MAQHGNYWSCTKFADWLRGTSKPIAATWEDWDTWRDTATNAHPFRYWLADNALEFLQDFVTWPTRKLYDIKYYINNRWVTRTHSLTAHSKDIKPGQWCDVGYRFLPCLFNELVDYVEVELAWWHIAWDEDARKKFKSPWYASGWFRWRTWRSPEAGLANLEWQRNLIHDEEYCKDKPYYMKPTPQAVTAQEILDLYTWWTQVYRNRPDPYEASGWTEYCEASRLANGGKISFTTEKSPELKKMYAKSTKLLSNTEKAYDKEDTEMLIRLVKIRHGLWT